MSDLRKLFENFDNLNGAKFVSIKNHKSSTTGEIANIEINTNVNVMNSKKKDVETISNVTDAILREIANEYSLPFDEMKKAYAKLLESKKRNISENKNERTKQSQAMSDAFYHVTKGLKLNKTTGELYVEGFVINKTVIQKGEYKKRNKRISTLCKDAIEKHFDLRMKKYRTLKLSNIQTIKMSGDTIILGE